MIVPGFYDVYLLPVDSWDFDDSIFTFDAEISESREDSYKATQYAIESGADISDYVIRQPRKYTLSGVVSAAMLTGAQDVYTRLTEVYDGLSAYADTRQPVTLFCGVWVEDCIITKISAKKDQGTGEALELTITLQTYELAEYTTTEIPPELLAPAVKAGATPESSTGGNQATDEDPEEPGYDASEKTGAAAIYDGENPFDSAGSFVDSFTF